MTSVWCVMIWAVSRHVTTVTKLHIENASSQHGTTLIWMDGATVASSNGTSKNRRRSECSHDPHHGPLQEARIALISNGKPPPDLVVPVSLPLQILTMPAAAMMMVSRKIQRGSMKAHRLVSFGVVVNA